MAKKSDYLMAITVGGFLQSKGCVVTLTNLRDKGWYVNYTLADDMKPQPAVNILNGNITFPNGSQEDIVLSFLLGQ